MWYKPVIISACFLGIKSRYDGSASFNAEAIREAAPNLVPVCPEQLGGLPTPRTPAVIKGGSGIDVLEGSASIITLSGKDVTSSFIKGAESVLEIARLTGAKKAVLKENSPSCGVNHICREYPGCDKGNKKIKKIRKGPGLLAALLLIEGIQVLGF
ncbi:MAG: DUF523 domain-containing protein [Thermodesulfobacteriota bacterium]